MKELKNNVRGLPEYEIGGTDFMVDMQNYQFFEKDNPANTMSMYEFWEQFPTPILFDKKTKNFYEGDIGDSRLPAHVLQIDIPPLSDLDPDGLYLFNHQPEEPFPPKVEAALKKSSSDEALKQHTHRRKKGKGI
jgi:hypothetical protein